MSAETPRPDATVALALAAQSYWVFPLNNYEKRPQPFGRTTHGDILKEGNSDFARQLTETYQHTATGFALILQASDPVPLVVVDVDAFIGLDEAWQLLAASEPLPPNAGVVKSASGGFHFWFRLPDAESAKGLPSTWDLGKGFKGDLRASRDVLQLIVLPGSVALNKHGAHGLYQSAGHPLSDPAGLALFPPSLAARLTGKARGAPAQKEGLPTEAQHCLSLLHYITEIPAGEQNQAVAWAGQVLGRIGPAKEPNGDLISMAWEQLRDKLPPGNPKKPWKFSDFERHFRSGYKAGAKSREAHTPTGGAAPTPDDVDAEMVSLFGSVPWLIEVVNSKGEFQEYILGHGGTPAQREFASSICSIKDARLPHILAEFSRLVPAAEQNVLTRSPLFLDPAWSKVMRHSLLVRRTTERMGNDPEARFWEILNEWARGAAQDGKFIDTASGPWRHLDSKTWIIQPADSEPLFSMHPDAVERLYSRIGDMPIVKALLAKHTAPRALDGKAHKQRTIAVAHLAPETQAHVRVGYERWVASKLKESKTNE